jgi:pyruvate/2-oxoglutarate dehydrogenase complex dihydrolipoamide acyltransferase (E2) component
MPTKVLMPQLGESVVEGTLTKWLKKPGQRVDEYEPLVEVNTDKVDSEIPSPAAGTLLEILVPEGTTIHAGTLLAWIGAPGETTGEDNGKPEAILAQSPQLHTSIPIPISSVEPDRDLGFISPLVAKIAAEQHLDLSKVTGTGQGRRITKKDVLAYLDSRPVQGRQVDNKPVERIPAAPTPSPIPSIPAPETDVPGEILPMTPVRRQIAEHMVLSKHTSPHVTTVMEVDLSRVVAHREANKAAFSRDGVNLTFTAYFIAAIIQGLKAYPIANSSWSEQGIVLHREINIGMATSLGEAGLIVPVIKNADGLSLLGLGRTINDLASRARLRQLKPDEVKGGTFTLTNHGISGSLFATPIINQPQCGILGVGAIQKRAVVVSGLDGSDAIAIRPMAYIGLTFDHRILDGAIADYFLGKVVESLENWN